MNEWLNSILVDQLSQTSGGLPALLLSLALAFCIGQLIAWVYMWTHTGLSYSQMYVASLVALTVLVALVMTVMAASIVVAFGLLAVFAVVRFRNVLKDTRDTVYVLWAIVEGLACGTHQFSIAVVGALAMAGVYAYLRFTSFGGRHRYDVVLSLHLDDQNSAVNTLNRILRRHSVRVQLASQHTPTGEGSEMSYRLQLRDPARSRELVQELETTQGVADVSLYHREDESEL